jgi:hypothetical protein
MPATAPFVVGVVFVPLPDTRRMAGWALLAQETNANFAEWVKGEVR